MADKYVRSTDGNNADDGSTWALAKADAAGVAAIDAAGDTIYFSQAHSESTAAAITLNFAGTLAAPTKLIGSSDAAEPPTAVSTAPVIATTGASAITINGFLYAYGLNFTAGDGATNVSIQCGAEGNTQVYENCVFTIGGTGGTLAAVGFGASNQAYPQSADVINCTFVFNRNDSRRIACNGRLRIKGGSVIRTGFTGPIFLTHPSGESSDVDVDGMDFSGLASTVVLATSTTGIGTTCRITFRNCKLPASWTGTLVSSGTPANIGYRYEMHNCDSGDTNYRMWVEDALGSIRSETTIVRSGGASDGTTPIAWKMATNTIAKYPLTPLYSPEIVRWNDTTGSSVTATIEIVHDSQGAGSGSKFQDDEIWLEVMYLGTSGYPLGSWIRDCKTDVLATAANQADSTETWTTTGLTTPVKQKLSVTFTPQEKGFVHARVVMAKASKTCYVCPKMTVA